MLRFPPYVLIQIAGKKKKVRVKGKGNAWA